MCGIAGVIGGRQGAQTRAVLKDMLGAISHRGPDSAGLYQDSHAAIGSRRLSIIDLATGDQPIANENDDVWVVYNGEVYNFQALREDLRAHGHAFRTATDTEAVVHIYEQYGRDGVARLEGMFAFALWDAKRRLLLLARDRFGKKPLYYTRVGDELLFASEVQAFLAHPGFVARGDTKALRSYLTYGVVTTEGAALAGVWRVPAASTATFVDGEPRVERYWQLRYGPPAEVSFDDAVAGFRERFDKAVTARLISDVPVGAFLSGGLDSSSVVAVMARTSPDPVRTFSVGFGEEGYSELEFARIVAEQFHTDHLEQQITPRASAVLPKLVGHFGEPFADASALPTYLISSVAGAHLKVVLSGDGGDELLGGYRRHHIANRGEWLHRSPIGAVGRAVDALTGGRTPRARPLRIAQTLGRALPERYVGWRSTFDAVERSELSGAALGSERDDEATDPRLLALLGDDRMSPAERVMAADIEHYLVFDLMPKTDITAMTCSLEVRCPFLDRGLVEYLATLPVAYRAGSGTGKRLLRAAMADVLPSRLLSRGKHGFDVPVDRWVAGELRDLAEDCLTSSRAARRGLVDAAVASRLLAEHRAGDLRSGQQIWTLIMLELWARAYLDGEYSPPTADPGTPTREVVRLPSAS